MPSLKEIKRRIGSVNGTLKITSAMKMVASSKLRKAQNAIGNMLPYQEQLRRILSDLLAEGASAGQKYTDARPVKKVVTVVFSSNSSLCGAFNSNVSKHFLQTAGRYADEGLAPENISIYTVGRKAADAIRKSGFGISRDYSGLADKPSFEGAAVLARELADMFLSGKADRIELIYNHFHSTALQYPVNEVYLPFSIEKALSDDAGGNGKDSLYLDNFIVEPDAGTVLEMLLPEVLLLKVYTVLLDACEAEHAARTIAMQTATDNGRKIIRELTLQYNKQRQQAITDELQDIVGGSMS